MSLANRYKFFIHKKTFSFSICNRIFEHSLLGPGGPHFHLYDFQQDGLQYRSYRRHVANWHPRSKFTSQLIEMHVPHGHKQPAVLCILTSGDKYLLLHRHREPNKDTYTPVGGKMDAYESPHEAAIRETMEETGISVDSARFCGVLVDNSPTRYNWICFVYTAEVDFHVPNPCEEGVLEWIHKDRLLEVPTPRTDRYIYEYVRDQRPFVFNAYYDNQMVLDRIVDELAAATIYERE